MSIVMRTMAHSSSPFATVAKPSPPSLCRKDKEHTVSANQATLLVSVIERAHFMKAADAVANDRPGDTEFFSEIEALPALRRLH
jgi:hypothetical protein